MTNIVLTKDLKTEKYLMARYKEDIHEVYEYVVCTGYNKVSDDWLWGHYFVGLEDAFEYYKMVIKHD